ncbi:hypothetical protein LO762_29565 [Actinocorallia sp. API 0066]|uniref:hypothetical protein n=1 Tax=Actinocorallia sp. API 0066 TaxID=2896846 RepID=UPI001E2C225E|nr:hypothetical protein [Actinocorallia sp. API 0066]MCD0453299.1 hypothetical protein [Actinocorallia sp. API 0066]
MSARLPLETHRVAEEIDGVLVERPRTRLPAILMTGEGAAAFVALYLDRPVDGSHGALVPYSDLEPPEPPEPVEPDEPENTPSGPPAPDQPYIDLVGAIARRFQTSMPKGSGSLRLPTVRAIESVLNAPTPSGLLEDRERELRDHLFTMRRQPLGRPADAHVQGVADLHWTARVVAFAGSLLARPLYGLRLRGRSLRWVGALSPDAGQGFLRTALRLTRNGDLRVNHDLVQRLLLTALIRDLKKAVRPNPFSVRRNRRRWSFLLVLGEVTDARPHAVGLLRNYIEILDAESGKDGKHPPLLLLGALDGPAPPGVRRLLPASAPHTGEEIARRLNDLFLAPRGLPAAAYEVPMPSGGEGGLEEWLANNPPPARPPRFWDGARRRAYLWRLVAGVAAVAVAVPTWTYALGPLYERLTTEPWCAKVADGQIVGVTDGLECSLAVPGPDGRELRELEKLTGQNNRAIGDAPSRTVVFYAPVSARDGAGNTTLNGIHSLRGAIHAQQRINGTTGKDHLKVRLLIANPGDGFAYAGSAADKTPDVTGMILKRAAKDRIVAVIGITQSRETSLAAIRRLGREKIPVVASSTTGSAMVDPDDPALLRYFQVSPTNASIAAVMAAFVKDSAQVKALVKGAPDGPPTAILVYHPDDPVFSADLAHKFEDAYGTANTSLVAYSEGDGISASDAAKRICENVAITRGVVVYVGRAARQEDLLNRMSKEHNCRKDRPVIPLLVEAPTSGFLNDPAAWMKRHSFVSLFSTPFDASLADENDGYTEFEDEFTEYFDGKGFAYRPNSDAAGAYDALDIVSHVTDVAYGITGDAVSADHVFFVLNDPGVGGTGEWRGATGPITLNGANRYPPDKEIYVIGTGADGENTVLLRCGHLARTWGRPEAVHACP